MNNQIQANNENNKRTLTDDPQYFGGYLNMARHNVYIISNHIAERLGSNVRSLPNEENIAGSFLCDEANKKVNWGKAYAIGARYLSILKMFDDERDPIKKQEEGTTYSGKDFPAMSKVLKALFHDLTEFRNDYSHYFSTEWESGIQRKMAVSPESAAFLKKTYEYAIAYSKERFKATLTDTDYAIAEGFEIVHDGNITEKGLVFFVSMFLEREDAFRFIGKIVGLKGTQTKEFLATRAVLLAFCVKLPHDKFVSEDPKQAFLLDSINELNKCPNILYSVMNEEWKKRFLPKLEEQQKENLQKNSSPAEEEIENYDKFMELLTKQVRHADRFSIFAMRFIDEMQLFDTWRFHINLGKILLASYQKHLNGEDVDRLIVEDVKAFGRLNDYPYESKIINKINRTDDPMVKFEQFVPHYHAENNKIGLCRNRKTLGPVMIENQDAQSKNKRNIKQPHPEVFLSLHELPKIILLEYLKKGETERLINEFVALNNSSLMNREFIDEIKTKVPQDWNGFQKKTSSEKSSGYREEALKYLQGRKKILNDVLAAYNLNDRQIPTKILNYWLNIQDVPLDRVLSERIKKMRKDCKQRLKALRKYRREGKGRIPKVGEMASFLAKDIVDMVIGEEKKKKITSFYYDKMQECLALYADPEKKALFIDIVNNELHLNETDGHPFLKNVPRSEVSYTTDIYERYLEEKGYKEIEVTNEKTGKRTKRDVSWMEKTFYKKERDPKTGKLKTNVGIFSDGNAIPLTIRRSSEKISESLDDWLAHVKNGFKPIDGSRPIDLPTNLFDETINALLKNDLKKHNVLSSEDAKWNELFKLWWSEVRKDSTQDYYTAPREYMIYDEKVCFSNTGKGKYSEYYGSAVEAAYSKKNAEQEEKRKKNPRLPKIERCQIEKVFSKTIGKTEKEIRIVEEKDRSLLLMIEQLLSDQGAKTENLKLKEYVRLLDQEVTIRIPFPVPQQKEGEACPEKDIVTKRKRKDYGALQRFISDRRLPGLYEYFPGDEIPMDDLEVELDAYNKAKQNVLDRAFQLEKNIIDRDMVRVSELFGKISNIQHKPYVDWLKEKSLIDEEIDSFLNAVRNKFSHNEYPPKGIMENVIKKWDEKAYASQIEEAYSQEINKILMQL